MPTIYVLPDYAAASLHLSEQICERHGPSATIDDFDLKVFNVPHVAAIGRGRRWLSPLAVKFPVPRIFWLPIGAMCQRGGTNMTEADKALAVVVRPAALIATGIRAPANLLSLNSNSLENHMAKKLTPIEEGDAKFPKS